MPQHRIYGTLGDSGPPHERGPRKGPLRRLINKLSLKTLLRRLLPLCIIAAIIGFFVLTIFVAWASKDLPDPDKLLDRIVAESTKIYDRTGRTLLYEVYENEKRTQIELKDIPDYAVKSAIAIEDKHFYEHKGIRWLSIARAMVANVLHLKSGRGGASTLTQQLVKNAILGNEKTYFRKIKEAILAFQIERKFSKEQILKLYFNEIPYGGTNYGLESAAQSYFGKSAREITLPEAATLAALPQAPTYYLNNLQKLKDRRNYVLELMAAQGYIAAAEAIEGQNTALFINAVKGTIKAPHFVLGVKQELTDLFGEEAVARGGLKVTTTLDYEKQQIAEEEIKKGVEAASKYKATNGALVALDTKTGQVLALVGSKDFFDKEHGGQFNVATQALRQPGSSFKPIVYAAAFERGFTPETILYDVVTKFPYDDKTYEPHNYDLKERGSITLRDALQGSINVPAVKVVFLVGVAGALDFAERLGYSTFGERANFGPSIVLGGGGVKLIEHTAAYGAFAGNGVLRESVQILSVEDGHGTVLYEWQPEEGKRVMEPNIAALVSSVLSDNNARAPVFGVRNYLTLGARPAAAKTGTTNDYHDAWAVGYTPSLVTGVWVGNNDNAAMKKGADGSVVAAPIWNAFMKRALQKTPIEEFPAPNPNTATKPILRGASGGVVVVEVNRLTEKIATSSTPPHLIEKKMFAPAHDIFWYIDRANPLGPPPPDPLSDPLTAAAENAVQAWIFKQQEAGVSITLGEPPSEFDRADDEAFRPVVSIITPNEGTLITTRAFTASIAASAPRGIGRVIFLIDDQPVGELLYPPFDFNTQLTVSNGTHTLSVRAYDPAGNANEAVAHFTLNVQE